jgi:hypothetical protein
MEPSFDHDQGLLEDDGALSSHARKLHRDDESHHSRTEAGSCRMNLRQGGNDLVFAASEYNPSRSNVASCETKHISSRIKEHPSRMKVPLCENEPSTPHNKPNASRMNVPWCEDKRP